MLGVLHTEMAIWKTYGDYLDDSGWTNALTQAGVASPGTADSYLKASRLTRTRYAHQVTALTLAKLQHEAFMETSGPHVSAFFLGGGGGGGIFTTYALFYVIYGKQSYLFLQEAYKQNF